MSELFLNAEFSKLWAGKDPYVELASIEGEVFRQQTGRKTFLFAINGKSYFAKLHSGVGWREIFKNLLKLNLPVVSARNEWLAVNRLHELEIATMTAVAYGEKGRNPATRDSFIVTEALLDTVSLEDYCLDWKEHAPNFLLKRRLIEKLANISRQMHKNNIGHRDFYLCHFLMHMEDGKPRADLRLSLIDLHRTLIKPNLRQRWIVKDIAGLYYSAMHIGLGKRDLLRFVKCYDRADLHSVQRHRLAFWSAVTDRAEAMYRKQGPSR